jgi:methionine synthase II (cobalamin-independent)
MTACNRPVAPADSADFCSEKMIEGWDQDPTNSRTLDELLDLYIKCYNDSIAAHKDKMHFGLHICRGERRVTASVAIDLIITITIIIIVTVTVITADITLLIPMNSAALDLHILSG